MLTKEEKNLLERAVRLMHKTTNYMTWAAKRMDKKEYFLDPEVEYAFKVSDFAGKAYCCLRQKEQDG